MGDVVGHYYGVIRIDYQINVRLEHSSAKNSTKGTTSSIILGSLLGVAFLLGGVIWYCNRRKYVVASSHLYCTDH